MWHQFYGVKSMLSRPASRSGDMADCFPDLSPDALANSLKSGCILGN